MGGPAADWRLIAAPDQLFASQYAVNAKSAETSSDETTPAAPLVSCRRRVLGDCSNLRLEVEQAVAVGCEVRANSPMKTPRPPLSTCRRAGEPLSCYPD